MDDFLSVSLLSLAMLVGCYVAGIIPLAVNFSEVRRRLSQLPVRFGNKSCRKCVSCCGPWGGGCYFGGFFPPSSNPSSSPWLVESHIYFHPSMGSAPQGNMKHPHSSVGGCSRWITQLQASHFPEPWVNNAPESHNGLSKSHMWFPKPLSVIFKVLKVSTVVVNQIIGSISKESM